VKLASYGWHNHTPPRAVATQGLVTHEHTRRVTGIVCSVIATSFLFYFYFVSKGALLMVTSFPSYPHASLKPQGRNGNTEPHF